MNGRTSYRRPVRPYRSEQTFEEDPTDRLEDTTLGSSDRRRLGLMGRLLEEEGPTSSSS